MTIKIEFPADRKVVALAIGKALTEIGQGTPAVDSFSKAAEEHAHLGGPQDHPTDSPAASDAIGAVDEQAGTQVDGAGQSATKVDEKGVAFNPEFCSKAAVPFYGAGKKKGQWKRRQGVDEDAYDEWYAGELFSDQMTAHEEDEPDLAAEAFGGQQHPAPDENVPQDAGQLMKWVSEQQAAGNITQQQVTDAYTALQLPFDAVMNPAYPVADNCAAIYHHLKGL